jgi:hypothetical protein
MYVDLKDKFPTGIYRYLGTHIKAVFMYINNLNTNLHSVITEQRGIVWKFTSDC